MLARSVTFNAIGQVGTLVIGFVGSVALARWLGPSDRGLLAIMISVNGLTLALVALGLPFAAQYYASRSDTPLRALLGNTLAYGGLLAAVVIPAFWLLQDPLSDLLADGGGDEPWVLASALIPLAFLQYTTASHLSGQLRFGLYNAILLVSKGTYLVCLVALLQFLDLGVAGGLLALAVAAGVVIVCSLVQAVSQSGPPSLDRALFARMLHYGLRVQIGALFRVLNFRLDVLILQFFRPLSEVGYYVVAVTLAELVLTLTRSFQVSVLPLVSRYEGEERQATTSISSIRHHGILAGAAILGVAALGPLVILYGFGPAFRSALVPMLILLPGMWFLGTATLIGSDLSGRDRPGLASLLSGATVLVTVALDLLLIPEFGAVGAALASLVAYTVFGATSLLALARVSGIGVRTLVRPTRTDLAAYAGVVRRSLAFVRLR